MLIFQHHYTRTLNIISYYAHNETFFKMSLFHQNKIQKLTTISSHHILISKDTFTYNFNIHLIVILKYLIFQNIIDNNIKILIL